MPSATGQTFRAAIRHAGCTAHLAGRLKWPPPSTIAKAGDSSVLLDAPPALRESNGRNRLKRSASELVDRIDALLPQTQCRQCGYAGCRPYAEAVAAGRAGINQCPPGGADCVRELAALLGVACVPLDPRFGATHLPATAVIDETLCIGCTLCITACPVDAIVGAARLMHTVIARDCTGCALCIPPCPVDCITLAPTDARPTVAQRHSAADAARQRFLRRESRRARERRAGRPAGDTADATVDQRIVQRAIERARQRQALRKPSVK